jgi:hypothetical protein
MTRPLYLRVADARWFAWRGCVLPFHDKQEELELEEALARSMADTSAHSESAATQDNPQAAILNYRALAQRTGSSSDCERGRDCSGSSWFGSSNWWMSSSGRGASGEGTQEAARSGRGLREAPAAAAAAPDSLFPDVGSNVQVGTYSVVVCFCFQPNPYSSRTTPIHFPLSAKCSL